MPTEGVGGSKDKARSRGPRILGAIAILLIVTAILSAWWVKHNLYASPFHLTELNEKEQQVLDAKLERLERSSQREGKTRSAVPGETITRERLIPERYTEDAARREIRITEKELNALIARDEETARRVAIDLSDDMASVKLVIPIDDDFPILGGKTLRLNCGIILRHEAGKPVVAVRGISIGGVPIPNAWLGNIKNIDLVKEFGGQHGFWEVFSQGVEDLKIREGSLLIKLKE